MGTIGIVTPFRLQANRIRDFIAVADYELYRAFQNASGHVDTAHGFQGDERDVMLFSLCSGPDMPSGAKQFINKEPYLFNVATSRARAMLHIVGNHTWAKSCGIKHIENLTKSQRIGQSPPEPTRWYPHESPYEKKLYDGLVQRGLVPRPQLQVLNRRLDLALVDEHRKLKIDLEVDGDCHRSAYGYRKTDDIWRDLSLESLGRKVIRFWTYQLRENFENCLDKVEKAWRD
jgi:very-short-patch-repair endonuclease